MKTHVLRRASLCLQVCWQLSWKIRVLCSGLLDSRESLQRACRGVLEGSLVQQLGHSRFPCDPKAFLFVTGLSIIFAQHPVSVLVTTRPRLGPPSSRTWDEDMKACSVLSW